MKKLLVLVALGLLLPASASAHGRWYDSAAKTAISIEQKYPAVSAAVCRPLDRRFHAEYLVDSYIATNGTRVWNHFLCAIYSTRVRGVCFAVAHHVGRSRPDGVNLGSWRYGPVAGCTTRALFG